MKEDKSTENFKRWPFVSDERREDGEINNGAFNLVQRPEEIESIHEATEENGLRPLLRYLNQSKGNFMTLGCASGLDGGLFYSYLELTRRDFNSAIDPEWPNTLDKGWHRYLSVANARFPGIAPLLQASCAMAWRPFYLKPETVQRLLVRLDLRGASEEDHKALAGHVQCFFELFDSGELE